LEIGELRPRLHLDDDHLSDVQVVAGDHTFPCHKLILASRSDVFEAMFSHKNTKESVEGKIILGEDPKAIKLFLECLYTDQMKEDLDEDMAIQLLLMSDKYNVPNIKVICIQCLTNSITDESCARIMIAARSGNCKVLEKRSTKFIARNIERIRLTEQWQEMARFHPELMILENLAD
jgi:speckle-type POZ protein